MSGIMNDVCYVERKVIKHNNFRFTIGKPSEYDPDIPVTMEGFSIETKIYFQEWVKWDEPPDKPNRYLRILEGPYRYVDYCSPYNDVQYVSEDTFIGHFEKGLSPSCQKYNYPPVQDLDFQRVITKHHLDRYHDSPSPVKSNAPNTSRP